MNLNDWQQQLQYFLIERRTLVIAVGIGLASLLLIGVAIWPTWQRIQTNNSAIKKLEQQVNKSSQRVSILSDLTPNDEQNFTRVAIALPEYKQPLNNLITLNLIASRSGVIIDDYNLNPGIVSTDSAQIGATTPKSQAVESFKFEVTLSGTLEQIEEAFAQIETSLPLMDIVQFDLASSSKNPGQYQVTLSLVSRYVAISSESVAKQPVARLSDQQQSVIEILQGYTLPSEGSDILPQDYNNQNLFAE